MRYPQKLWNDLLQFRDTYFEEDSIEIVVVKAVEFFIKYTEENSNGS